jgi:dTDP-4-dehydrorhamnose 3,5-epimerase
VDLAKIESTGFIPVDADEMLVNYVRLETRESHQTASR